MRTERARRAAPHALVLALALAASGAPPPAAAHEPQIVRQWWLTAKDASNARLRVVFERRDAEGSTRIDDSTSAIPYASLRGLSAADVAAPASEMRRFEIAEDAGTIAFQGVVGNGRGKGTFEFATDAGFQRQLARRGMRPASDLEALALALHHFKISTVDDAIAAGVQGITPADLTLIADRGMTPEYLRAFKGVALAPKTMAALAQLRDHGVTAEYVQAFASAGYRPISVEELTSARDHGVDARGAVALRAAMPSLTMADLGTLHDHGVRSSLVQALARSRYRNASIADITALAEHGVTGDYITDLDRIGYHPSAADVVRLREHGVSIAFIQRLRSHGYGGMSVSDIIKLYEHGI